MWGEILSPHYGIEDMININITKHPILLVMVVILLVGAATACQAPNDPAAPVVDQGQGTQTKQPPQNNPVSEPSEGSNESAAAEGEAENADESVPGAAEIEAEPVDIDAAWLSSPHANAFVLDADGNNNPCARCHAPINWEPSMDDLPESCFACKFELDEPPPYIPEDEWLDIPCNVCHEVDKNGEVQPEYSWLEIAALDEYAAVESPTELCMKCHDPINVPEHAIINVAGGHEGYECTQCHDAHDATASCGAVDCHEDVIEPDTPIAGHDEDHRDVSCAACHDADGMEVGPSEELGYWTTFAQWSSETAVSETETKTETGIVAFTSHNTVLEASCERCHYADNPWELSDNVDSP
jgi:hypothetical protein